MRKYLTEFIGTFFLVLTIGLTVLSGSTLAPLAIGSSLMIMVYMGGHISGAHYNPAVSLAALLAGKLPAKEFIPYLVSQVAGAFAAAFAVYLIRGKTFAPEPGTEGGGMILFLAPLGISQATAVNLTALLVEVLYTFALALVVLNVATSKKTTGNSYFGLAIGFTVAVGAFAGGDVSGGAFNPAVGTGPALFRALHSSGTLKHVWLHVVGPFAGAALAALVFNYQEGEK
jgi:aquaporin Z